MITTKKMDNTRGTKKGICRFTKQSPLGKSKLGKEKIKKLSFVRSEKLSLDDNEMIGLGVSNGEDEFSNIVSGKKHKIPRKCSDDPKAVDHSSVPRKLRSAMKKRTSKFPYPPLPRSKKLNHSDKKQRRSHLSLQQNFSETITKDEEEAVETLYILAGMLTQNDTASNSRIQDDSSLAAEEVKETPPIEHEESKEAAPSSAAQYGCISANEERSSIPMKDSTNHTESRTSQKMDYLTTSQYHEDMNNTATPPTLLLGGVIEQSNDKLQNAASFVTSRENSHGAGLKFPKEIHDNSLYESKLEKEKALDPFAGKELKWHHGNRDSEHHGSLLQPSLSPTTSKDSGRPGLLHSFAVEAPLMPDTTCTIKLESAETGFPVAKINKGAINKRPWKRCAAHIYICHVIQALKTHECSSDHVEPHEVGQMEEVVRVVSGQINSKGLRNVWSGFSLNSGSNYDDAGGFGEYRNRILPEKSQNHDQQLVYSAKGEITMQKQSFDFLSLSTGSVGAKSSINVDELGVGNWSKGHAQPHVSPSLISIEQQHTYMPQAMPQTHYSVAYRDQHSAASKELQTYLYPMSSGYSTLHKDSSIPMKEHQYQQMQLAELASRVKHVGSPNPVSQFPTVQTSRIETSNWIPHSQTLSHPYLPMHKVQGDSRTRQHHQQLIPPTLMLSTVVRRPEHLKLSSYEENYSGFCSGNALPLQLLCNERL